MSFKVFDLACAQGHVFEGWFRSHDDYESQKTRGLVQCPICQSTEIERRLSAPSVHTVKRTASAGPTLSAQQQQLRALYAQMREQLRQVENVGDAFVQEARKIHVGAAPERPIRGTATPAEREALLEEGIAAVPLPFPLDDEALH